MKFKKIVSILCATAIFLSASSFASAATESEPLSEYAGQSIICQVFDDIDGELTSRLIEVSIPDGATKAEEDALVFAAAYGMKARSTVDILSTKRNFDITTSATSVGSGKAKQDYARIHVSISVPADSMPFGNKLTVQCKNITTEKDSGWKDLNLDTLAQTVIFYTDEIELFANDSFEVYAKTFAGTAKVSTCTIQGSTF